MKKTGILLALLSGIFMGTRAQSVSFLNVNPDLRSAALGNGGIALDGNASALYVNPSASLFAEAKAAVSYAYLSWMRESGHERQLHALTGYVHIGNQNGLLGGIRYFAHDKIRMTDENGSPTGNFRPKEFSLDLAYARKLSRHWSAAAGIHYISSDMGRLNEAKKGSAFAADLSAMYHAPHWNFALALCHFGSKIDYGFGRYELPATLKAGGAYRHDFSEKHRLTANAEMDFRMQPSDYKGAEAGLGIEYRYRGLLALRAGYHLGNEKKTGPSYATVGGGVMFRRAEIQATYWIAENDSPVKGSFGLSACWNF